MWRGVSWESDRTSELGPVRPFTPGRHRRRRGSVIGVITAAVLLVLAVSGAMLSPVLTGWPPSDEGAAAPTATLPSTVDIMTGAPAPTNTPTPTPSPSRTKPTAAAATTRPAVTGIAGLENRVFELTNVERAEKGCPALRLDTRLRTAARGYSDEMARYGAWNHVGHDGSSPGDRMRRAGYDTTGGWAENIAKGYPTAEAVMQGWMASSGHRANILNCNLKALGVGVVRSNGRLFWTQDFGGR